METEFLQRCCMNLCCALQGVDVATVSACERKLGNRIFAEIRIAATRTLVLSHRVEAGERFPESEAVWRGFLQELIERALHAGNVVRIIETAFHMLDTHASSAAIEEAAKGGT